jgi:hypothetical protein
VLAVRTYRSAKSSISSGQRVHSFDQRFHEPKPSAIEPIREATPPKEPRLHRSCTALVPTKQNSPFDRGLADLGEEQLINLICREAALIAQASEEATSSKKLISMLYRNTFA